MIGVIVYRLAIRGILAKTSLSDDIAVSSVIVSGAGALANFLFILFMSTLYYKLAHFLTDWGKSEYFLMFVILIVSLFSNFKELIFVHL